MRLRPLKLLLGHTTFSLPASRCAKLRAAVLKFAAAPIK
jgi:hypothetical protein